MKKIKMQILFKLAYFYIQTVNQVQLNIHQKWDKLVSFQSISAFAKKLCIILACIFFSKKLWKTNWVVNFVQTHIFFLISFQIKFSYQTVSHVQLNIHRKGDKLLSFHSMSALMPNIACKLFWMIVLKSAFRFFPGHICLYIWLFFCTLKVLNMSQWEWIISKLSYTAAYITSYEKS